jgi:aspartyl-tRNA(Asn)/glutamyl-tRNA(Gln) amidotransferase subunit A
VRTLILGDFRRAFERYDGLVSPTSPTPAFRLGEKVEDPLAMYLSDVYTIPVNLAGIPAVSIPCGLEDGLPVGLQIMGKVLDEATLLRVAWAMEEAIGFRERPPAGRGVG